MAGLIGGVWPGLTWWYAFARRALPPEVSWSRALRSSFAALRRRPKRNNTVPGQFSEWFDGESLVNRGMRLSPWEPPRFLWAAVEGVCGLVLQPGLPRISPLIPADWTWVAIRDLPYHGELLSYFVVREGSTGFRIFSTAPVESEWDVAVYQRDVSDEVRLYSDSAVAIALAREGGAVIIIGNTGAQTLHTPVTFNVPKPLAPHFQVRIYDSERCAWEEHGVLSLEDLHSNSLAIGANGFRLIELSVVES